MNAPTWVWGIIAAVGLAGLWFAIATYRAKRQMKDLERVWRWGPEDRESNDESETKA